MEFLDRTPGRSSSRHSNLHSFDAPPGKYLPSSSPLGSRHVETVSPRTPSTFFPPSASTLASRRRRHREPPVELDAVIGEPTESNQRIILSVVWRSGKLGAAYFDEESQQLHVVPDIIENPQDQAILRGLFFQVQPQTLVLKTKQDAEKMALINQLAGAQQPEAVQPCHIHPQWTDTTDSFQETDESSDREDEAPAEARNTTGPAGAATKCKLHLLPNSFFNLESSRCKVMLLQPTSQQTCLSETERLMLLKSVFPLDYPAAIQATGALLTVLERWKRGQDLERVLDARDHSSFSVSSIHVDCLQDFVWLDQSTFLNLQIFSQESHPASAKKGQSSSSKEGLSLFGITAACHSQPGFLQLRRMFLRPTRDIGELRRRYSVIRFCLETCNMESVNGLITSLRHISNVQPTLMNLSVGQGTAGEWKKLLTTSQHLMALSEMAASLPQNIALFCQLSQLREGRHLYKITSTIHRMVNFDESKRASRAVVNYGLDRKNI